MSLLLLRVTWLPPSVLLQFGLTLLIACFRNRRRCRGGGWHRASSRKRGGWKRASGRIERGWKRDSGRNTGCGVGVGFRCGQESKCWNVCECWLHSNSAAHSIRGWSLFAPTYCRATREESFRRHQVQSIIRLCAWVCRLLVGHSLFNLASENFSQSLLVCVDTRSHLHPSLQNQSCANQNVGFWGEKNGQIFLLNDISNWFFHYFVPVLCSTFISW